MSIDIDALHLLDCNSDFVKDETCPLFLIEEGSPVSFSFGFDFDLQISMFISPSFLYDLFVAGDPHLKISFCHRHLGNFPWYYVLTWSQKEQYQIKDTTEIGPPLKWILNPTAPRRCWPDTQQLLAYVSNISRAPSASNRTGIVTWRPSLWSFSERDPNRCVQIKADNPEAQSDICLVSSLNHSILYSKRSQKNLNILESESACAQISLESRCFLYYGEPAHRWCDLRNL